jgi:hypothetical protein
MADTTTSGLAWYVHALGEDAEFAATSAQEAAVLVGHFVGKDNPYKVPDEVLARATIEVGADLYYRKASRNGIVGLDGADAQPFRLNRDPMAAAYPLLRQFIPAGL